MAINVKTDDEYRQELAAQSQAAQYIPSETVTEARTQLADVAAGKPANYENAHAERLGGLYDQILNRDPYTYNPMQDNTFMQYRDQYQQMSAQGAQLADQTTRQMSGGYGNTWSTGAANQIYGEQMKGINDILPAMEQNAYAAYQAEGDLLNTQLAATADKESREYSRWKDAYDDWTQDRDFAAGRVDQAAQMDMNIWKANAQNALTILGWQREDSQTVRKTAYDWAMQLLEQGIMPIDTVLEQAGISAADAQALFDKMNSGGGGGGRRRRGGRGGTTAAADTGSDPYWYIAGTRGSGGGSTKKASVATVMRSGSRIASGIRSKKNK